ncbi:MAG: hypothetical protein PHY12_01050 [Eubacteriales bacterium]|nr:hypothetical protein [Eubacteriales bacterium]
MFEEWKQEAVDYVLRHLDRRKFRVFSARLPRMLCELADDHLNWLMEQGVIDENGESTEADYDEDELLEALLTRYLARHPEDEEHELFIASLIDRYLALQEEYNEDR